jgi:alpha-N-arabinofuranosidase
MLLTPTYHVFEMYKVHQDATLLPTNVSSNTLVERRPVTGSAGDFECKELEETLQISASASRDAAGKIHVSLCNLHPDDAAEVTIDLRGVSVTGVSGRVLTAPAMNTINTFDAPATVEPQSFDGARLSGPGLTVELPARSVVVLELTA